MNKMAILLTLTLAGCALPPVVDDPMIVQINAGSLRPLSDISKEALAMCQTRNKLVTKVTYMQTNSIGTGMFYNSNMFRCEFK